MGRICLLVFILSVNLCSFTVSDTKIQDSIFEKVATWARVDVLPSNHNVSEQCFNDTRTVQAAVLSGSQWALRSEYDMTTFYDIKVISVILYSGFA